MFLFISICRIDQVDQVTTLQCCERFRIRARTTVSFQPFRCIVFRIIVTMCCRFFLHTQTQQILVASISDTVCIHTVYISCIDEQCRICTSYTIVHIQEAQSIIVYNRLNVSFFKQYFCRIFFAIDLHYVTPCFCNLAVFRSVDQVQNHQRVIVSFISFRRFQRPPLVTVTYIYLISSESVLRNIILTIR